jgi:GNAT superfamily N-acetyltransferase
MTGYRICPLDATVGATDFVCGQPALDEYIRRYASQDVKRDIARVFVAVPEENTVRLAGFYTLSAGSVNCYGLPVELARKLPRYPVPVALIGRLAVDENFQGKGLGSMLLADACHKVNQASSVLAVAGIVVDAKDETSAAFYRHFCFTPLPGQPERLLLPARPFRQKTD